jgi:hypothetical protein
MTYLIFEHFVILTFIFIDPIIFNVSFLEIVER